jgi:hypothetical protein
VRFEDVTDTSAPERFMRKRRADAQGKLGREKALIGHPE